MKKYIFGVIAIVTVATMALAYDQGFLNAEHFIIGTSGDAGIHRTAAATLEITNGGVGSANRGTLQVATLSAVTSLIPSAAAGTGLGTAAAPWGNLILGTAATNAFTVTPASLSAARAITLPDPGGAASLFYANATTAQNLLANAFQIADASDTTKQILFTASGMTTAKGLTIAAASANSRTYTLGDNGGNGNFNVFSAIPASVQQPPQAVFVASAYTNATTTFSNVTGLSFPVSASLNYHAKCRITWQGSANTTGPKYQFTGPASPTAVAVGLNSVVTATTVIAASAVAFSSPVANSGTVTAATNFTDTIDVGVVNGVNAGTVQLQAAANGAGTLTIQPGSYCQVQ